MKISEIITDKYKLRIPPTVYYELLADVQEAEEEQEHILDKVRADITKFADTISLNIGEVKAKYTNIGQHDGLEQALEIIEGNIEGDFDIDKWMAESEVEDGEV